MDNEVITKLIKLQTKTSVQIFFTGALKTGNQKPLQDYFIEVRVILFYLEKT